MSSRILFRILENTINQLIFIDPKNIMRYKTLHSIVRLTYCSNLGLFSLINKTFFIKEFQRKWRRYRCRYCNPKYLYYRSLYGRFPK